MSKKPITVKNPANKYDKIGINLNDFDYRAVQYLKIGPSKTMSKVAFQIISSEADSSNESTNIDYLKKYAKDIDLPYSEAFRKMLISYLKKELSGRKYDLQFIHKKLYGQNEKDLFLSFLNYLDKDITIKGLDIIKLHYIDGWSLRKIAIKKGKSAEYIRMSKEEALRKIRIATVKKNIPSIFSSKHVNLFQGVAE